MVCSGFVEVCSACQVLVVEVSSGFVEVSSGFAEVCSGFVEVSSGVAEICSGFVEVSSGFAEVCSVDSLRSVLELPRSVLWIC